VVARVPMVPTVAVAALATAETAPPIAAEIEMGSHMVLVFPHHELEEGPLLEAMLFVSSYELEAGPFEPSDVSLVSRVHAVGETAEVAAHLLDPASALAEELDLVLEQCFRCEHPRRPELGEAFDRGDAKHRDRFAKKRHGEARIGDHEAPRQGFESR
jgi:hypothetical protein